MKLFQLGGKVPLADTQHKMPVWDTILSYHTHCFGRREKVNSLAKISAKNPN